MLTFTIEILKDSENYSPHANTFEKQTKCKVFRKNVT